ncbi:hypothetical protein BDU57DRAFT_438165 [Ampelomyces quisqualis]|uniref:Uncharacterized protein n=1 Tax=Ampelomyces quisqualis TaxID=50730 RepID=A0A6A5QYS3_AMPQU|nr:hypothetical protein BDU57DRAFT_438165 [Ampelomyces quisqualis]
MLFSDEILPEYPIWNSTIPQAIIADHSDGTYSVSWAPTSAGIIHRSPSLVKREDLLKSYPQIVQAWESNQRNEKEQAHQTEQTFANFIARFLDTNDNNHCAAAPPRGVACDQSLLPGMHRHWGELRKCETHPPDRPPVLVCKGCRVTHYAQECRAFDRGLIMARGARVPVCEKCANMASAHAETRSCACGSRWTCFRCREVELEGLAKAREKYVEGRCGNCAEASGEERFVEFCLLCRGWRVYADIMEAEVVE